jgi:RNA polymerase sigma-70 factor (ECF subfamily)
MPLTGADLNQAFLLHRDQLFGFIMALARDLDAAEEIFQDVGVAVSRAAADNTPVQNALPWLRGLCRHRTTDYFRRRQQYRRRQNAMAEMADLVEQSFVENIVDEEENRRRVSLLRQCLDKLSARARQIVDARYADHASIGAIAQRFAWQPNAVKVALSKARRTLADCVQRHITAEEP